MGEFAREFREGKTWCTIHGCPLIWVEGKKGRSVFTCPDCHAGKPGAREGPLIRYSPTFWRDRPLTDKEKACPPKKRS